MIDSIPQIMEAIETTLRRRGMDSYVLWAESQFLFVGYNSVQVVVSDGTKVNAISSVIEEVHTQMLAQGVDFEYRVRAQWTLESIGEVQPLYGGDGGLRAASVISALLKSGEADRVVHVIVTWAADKAIREIMPSADLRVVAGAIIRSRLAQGGSSAWDPTSESTIEINAAAAAYVSHLLQRAA